ncbi:MAG: hypothetical protein ACREMP_07475 [Candidatus Tyrphobacter sp.]
MGRDLHVHSHPSRIEFWRHLVEIAALSIAALWSFYVFIYQERIKPAGEPAELQATVSVDHTSLRSNKEFIKVGVLMKNIGGTPLELAGLIVNAYGVKYATVEAEHVAKPLAGIEEISRAFVPGNPSLQYTFADTWEAFGSPRLAALLPNGEFPETFVFAIPPGAFDIVKIDYIVCWARPRSKPWPVAVGRQPDGSFWFRGALSTENIRSGLRCHYQLRGEYYPL